MFVGVGCVGVALGGTGVFVGTLVFVGIGVVVSVTSGGDVGDAVGVRVGGRVRRDVGVGDALVGVGDIDTDLLSAAVTVFFVWDSTTFIWDAIFCSLIRLMMRTPLTNTVRMVKPAMVITRALFSLTYSKSFTLASGSVNSTSIGV